MGGYIDITFDISTATTLEYFGTLEDPRIERTKLHHLLDIVALTICAVICGADDPVDIEQYGHEKCAWLQTFLELPNGIQSHDTIGRVLRSNRSTAVSSVLFALGALPLSALHGHIVPIDGKTVRHSYDMDKVEPT